MSREHKLSCEWKRTTLQELVYFQRGYDITKEQQRPGNIPVVSSSGVNSYHSEPKADGPGIIIGRKGSLGTVHYVDGPYWPHDTTLWSKDLKGNHPRFVYYFLHTLGLERYDVGNSNPTLNRNHIHGLDVSIPPPAIQERIASVLSAYDDLIENNRRRIALLEQAARLLYKEWFVHLRFPGHEHVKITDGVPEGWEKKTLADFAASVSYGLTASSSEERIGPKFLRITDIVPNAIDWNRVPFCVAEDNKIEQNRLQIGDVVVARTGATVGYAKRISYLPSEAVFASYLVRFRFTDPATSLIAGIYMESSAYKEFVRNHAGGAAQPNANAKVLGSPPLLLPSHILRQQFSDSVSPLITQRDLLITQSGHLARARDLLLPRLMSGEIPV